MEEEAWEFQARALNTLLASWEGHERGAARDSAALRLLGFSPHDVSASGREAAAANLASGTPAGPVAAKPASLFAWFGQRRNDAARPATALEARRGVYCSREEAVVDACIARARALVRIAGRPTPGDPPAAGQRRAPAREVRVAETREDVDCFDRSLQVEAWAVARLATAVELATTLAASHARLAASPGKRAARVHRDGAAAGCGGGGGAAARGCGLLLPSHWAGLAGLGCSGTRASRGHHAFRTRQPASSAAAPPSRCHPRRRSVASCPSQRCPSLPHVPLHLRQAVPLFRV